MVETANNSVRGIVRIVNVSSNAHENVPQFGIDLQDVDQVNGGPISRYGSSKLASILHTKELARRFSMPEARAAYSGFRSEGNTGGEIWVSSVHPGMVKTYGLLPIKELLDYLVPND
jgi:NAD(P)-dependent dehydrogenase (short-subunit alcohol dehydrogenase family)